MVGVRTEVQDLVHPGDHDPLKKVGNLLEVGVARSEAGRGRLYRTLLLLGHRIASKQGRERGWGKIIEAGWAAWHHLGTDGEARTTTTPHTG